MTKYYLAGECIEGENVELNLRKSIKPVRMVIPIDGVDTAMFKMKSTKRSIAIITKELSPKVCLANPNSHLDIMDELNAFSISIFLTVNIGMSLIRNFSSTHSIQNFQSLDYTYAIIDTPYLQQLNLALKKENP